VGLFLFFFSIRVGFSEVSKKPMRTRLLSGRFPKNFEAAIEARFGQESVPHELQELFGSVSANSK
jgi:hypothetical protein